MVFMLCLLILPLASAREFSNSCFKSSLHFKSSVNRLSKRTSNPYHLKNRIIGGTLVDQINHFPYMAFLFSYVSKFYLCK